MLLCICNEGMYVKQLIQYLAQCVTGFIPGSVIEGKLKKC